MTPQKHNPSVTDHSSTEAGPRAIIIAGPNGAGKTTFAREFLPVEARCPAFVNADLIAAGLSPFAPEAAALKAGRIMLAEIDDHVTHRRSFALETTLSGRIYATKIRHWRNLGYRVILIFLQLPSADMAIERVRLRVSQGGHNIPDEVVRRRFDAGPFHLTHTYQPIVDAWFLYENQHRQPLLLDQGPAPTDDLAQAVLAALSGAGLRAAEDARRANTHMVITVEGKVQHISPEEYVSLRQAPQKAPA